jgi:predicted nuclease of restriction endonuclease-like (RecB) superfamily
MKKINTSRHNLSFDKLIYAIRSINDELSIQASRAVNVSLTLRNWIIGFYIVEYELRGSDRAKYGEELIEVLARSLSDIPRTQKRELNRYRLFYKVYPQFGEAVTPQLMKVLQIFPVKGNKIGETPSPQLSRGKASDLLQKLSFSHLELLISIEDNTKRIFYEIECIRGNWSVRELKRQINSLYYERSGLSEDKKKLSELTQKGVETSGPKQAIRDPYIFEFLGLKAKEVMSESHLEDQLLDKLQEFLLELGHGFCFEARQKRILIGNTHNFVDLVFYHRILKCHVLVELKLGEFSHENIGHLNTYVSWYEKNMKTEGDNFPVGILLCTNKDHALVEYALAGMDNNLFVSKYQLELPKKEEMQKFIEKQIKDAEPGN